MRESQFVTELSAFFSRQNDVTAASRGSFGLAYDRFLGTHWVAEALVGLDRNIQLGLDLRETVGVGGGRYLMRTNQSSLIVLARLHGQPRDSGRRRGHRTARKPWSAAATPTSCTTSRSSRFDATSAVYPSLTISGRVRVEAAASVKREIVSDFYLSLSIFDSFDSRDPTTLTAKNDWGPTVSIGWKF